MRNAIPVALRRGPFSVADARRVGLRWDDLQSKNWTRLRYGQYSWTGLQQNVMLTLRAVAQRMPADYAFSGPTAAWLLGLDFAPADPIEVTVRRELPVRARAGLRLRRAALREEEVILCRGFRATYALRTVRELGGRADLGESVVALDMAVRANLIDLSQLTRHVETHGGQKGIKRLRRAIRFADARSESPMETRVRMELIKARLPRPDVQADLCDSAGNFVGRADLYYPDRKLVIEYDGENHKDRLVADVRRQNALVNAGYHVLRFTGADLRVPGLIAAQVRHARGVLGKFPDRPDFAA